MNKKYTNICKKNCLYTIEFRFSEQDRFNPIITTNIITIIYFFEDIINTNINKYIIDDNVCKLSYSSFIDEILVPYYINLYNFLTYKSLNGVFLRLNGKTISKNKQIEDINTTNNRENEEHYDFFLNQMVDSYIQMLFDLLEMRGQNIDINIEEKILKMFLTDDLVKNMSNLYFEKITISEFTDQLKQEINKNK